MISSLRSLGMGFLVGLIITTLAGGSFAHDNVSDFYPRKWKRDKAVDWHFTDTFHPSNQAWRDRVKDGAQAWNNLYEPMFFVKQTEIPDFNATVCPDRYQKNAIHMSNIDGKYGYAADTKTCVFNGDRTEMFSVQIRFDTAESWYVGSTYPPPYDRTDVQAWATHEFGHATGFHGPHDDGHFEGSGTHCTNNPKETMCPFMPYGYAYFRSLESHDIHTFDKAYPAY